MWTNLILIVPWIIALVVAYFFIGTIGSKLKKDNPTLYRAINDDEGEIQNVIDAEKGNKAKLEKELTELDNDDLTSKATKQEEINKSQVQIEQLETIKSKGLNSWDFSLTNICWVVGIFLLVGIVLHLLTKFMMKWIFNKNE